MMDRRGSVLFRAAVMLAAVLLLGCGCAAALGDAAVHLSPPPEDWADRSDVLIIRILDLGMSDGMLVSLEGKRLLIDGGSSQYRDALRKAVTKYDFSDVDMIINTHPHSDHCVALTWMLDRGLLRSDVLIHGWPENSRNERQLALLAAAEKRNIPVQHVVSGDTAELGSLHMTFWRWDEGSTYNHRSLVIRMTYGSASILLPSDASGAAEHWFMENVPEALQRADILKMPHHGVDRLVTGYGEAVSPQLVIFTRRASASKDILRHVEAMGWPHYHTASGTVTLYTDGQDWYVEQLHREI